MRRATAHTASHLTTAAQAALRTAALLIRELPRHLASLTDPAARQTGSLATHGLAARPAPKSAPHAPHRAASSRAVNSRAVNSRADSSRVVNSKVPTQESQAVQEATHLRPLVQEKQYIFVYIYMSLPDLFYLIFYLSTHMYAFTTLAALIFYLVNKEGSGAPYKPTRRPTPFSQLEIDFFVVDLVRCGCRGYVLPRG